MGLIERIFGKYEGEPRNLKEFFERAYLSEDKKVLVRIESYVDTEENVLGDFIFIYGEISCSANKGDYRYKTNRSTHLWLENPWSLNEKIIEELNKVLHKVSKKYSCDYQIKKESENKSGKEIIILEINPVEKALSLSDPLSSGSLSFK